MRRWFLVVLALLLVGCVHAPLTPVVKEGVVSRIAFVIPEATENLVANPSVATWPRILRYTMLRALPVGLELAMKRAEGTQCEQGQRC